MSRNNVIEAYTIPINSTEPFTVAEAKAYARITDSSEDALIGELITAARQAIEKFTQLALVPSNVVAILDNSYGEIELPYGPFVSDLVVVDKEGTAVTATILGERFKYLESPINNYLKCTYKAGYTAKSEAGYVTMPIDLLNAIKDQFAFLYGNRGDNTADMHICGKAYRTVLRYTRKPLFV